MITVTIVLEAGGIVAFDAAGHANFAPHGQDIVCAGVASVVQTAAIGLERVLKRETETEVAGGKLKLRLTAPPDSETQAILETMVLGLKEIAAQYPRQVVIRESRR